MSLLEKIWTKVPETASRVRQRIEAILDYARASGFRTGDNPARWRGHLDHLLPAQTKVAKRQHQPALDYRAMPAFMAVLRKRDGIAALALEFTILCATRTNETTKARRSEIDGDVWVIPPERMTAVTVWGLSSEVDAMLRQALIDAAEGLSAEKAEGIGKPHPAFRH